MKKRLLAILLIATMLFSAIPVHAEETIDGPAFVVDQLTAVAGETVDVTINVKNNPGISSTKIQVTYDDDVLVLNSITYNADLGTNVMQPQELKSPFDLNWVSPFADFTTENYLFATLNFTVVENAAPGEYPITITYDPDDVYNLDEDNVAFEIVNGGVTVECLHTDKVEVPAKSATCTEAGNNLYFTCACGAVFKADGVTETTVEAEIIPATGHTYVPVVTAPTCTEKGYTTYTCACGESYVADEVPATGHTYVPVVTAPTCTEKGYTTYTCACGDSYVADEVPATGHTYVPVVTAPTCTEKGYTTYTCACGDSYVDDYVDATGHDHVPVVTAPTCTEAGYTTYTCACGDSYVADEVPALGHSFTNYVSNNDATCTEDGTKTAKCDRCDVTDTKADEGTAKGHDHVAVVTDPTCTEAGYTTYTCACGDTYVADEVPALGHAYSEEWSAGEEGHWHECAACHDKADFAEHDFGTEGDVCLVCAYERAHVHRLTLVPAVEATCTTEGTKAYYTCSGCENWFEDAAGTILIEDKASVKTEKAPHAYEETVVDATCTTEGTITYTCECGDTYTETIPVKDHNYEDGICTDCGAEDPNYEEDEPCDKPSLKDWIKDWLKNWWGDKDEETECEHSYVDEVKAPTCTEKGYTKHTCEKCGDSYTDSYVDATGHNYVKNVCTECGHKKIGWIFWFDWFWKK